MASAYWRTDHTVSTLLSEREVGWDFLQLVKLLLSMAQSGELKSDSDVLEMLSQHVNFQASLASDFPPGEIREIKQGDTGKPVNVTVVNNMLSAVNGPLPEPFLAWVRELASNGDNTMADFLDIFNNRLMALRYLICRTTRPNLADSTAKNSESGELLQALSGVFFNRKVQHSDLRLSGLLANNRLSFPVAKKILLFEMGLELKAMNSYRGGWLSVDKSDHSRLGQKTSALGMSATLGKKVWDQQKSVEWVIGPLPWEKVKRLVPGGSEYSRFAASLSRITDCRCDSDVVLLLPQSQVPLVQLGEKQREIVTVEENETENITIAPVPALALGLTTVLPTAEKRKEKELTITIRFTVETSNPSVLQKTRAH